MPINSLLIDGTPKKVGRCYTHYRVVADGQEIFLPYRLFKILSIMALHSGEDGWVERKAICPGNSRLVSKYIYRGRRDYPAVFQVEAHWQRGWRLWPQPAVVHYSPAPLGNLNDAEIMSAVNS